MTSGFCHLLPRKRLIPSSKIPIAKVQGPNGRAHGVEELLFQGSATAELHEGHAEDVGEEKE